jgi:hypothetical protein
LNSNQKRFWGASIWAIFFTNSSGRPGKRRNPLELMTDELALEAEGAFLSKMDPTLIIYLPFGPQSEGINLPGKR